MNINLIPIANTVKTTAISVVGSVVTIDGVDYDIDALIPEGGDAEADVGGVFSGINTREEVNVRYFYELRGIDPVNPIDIAKLRVVGASGAISSPINMSPIPRSDEVQDV